MLSRRSFATSAVSAGAAVLGFPAIAQAPQILGQGSHRYRAVPGWGVLDEKTPVKNCHGIVQESGGHLVMLNDHTANNVLIYDTAGKLVSKWGTEFPGAHGLSLVKEGSREVLYLTDLQRHAVFKTTLEGEVLQTWGWPGVSEKYAKEADYKPSWTLHAEDGSFFVLDGYGRDFILHYRADGSLGKIFGGAEGGIVHWGPHGGMLDQRPGQAPTLLIAMSDQLHLQRMTLEGALLEKTPLPGGNPRQIRTHGGHYFVGHLADNWPKDRNSRGFVSVLDSSLRVISNIGGTAPEYDAAGALRPMKHEGEVFVHPHDLIVDREESLYVVQFASGNTYPIKLERV
jgi:peptidylamidoglycolate lyase